MTKLFINGKSRNIYKNNDGSYYYKQGGQNIDASQFFKKGGELKAKYKHLGGSNDENTSLILTLPNFPLNKSTNSRKKITGGFGATHNSITSTVTVTFDNLLNLIDDIALGAQLTANNVTDSTQITEILDFIDTKRQGQGQQGQGQQGQGQQGQQGVREASMKNIKQNIVFLKAIVKFGKECEYFSKDGNEIQELENYYTKYTKDITDEELGSLNDINIDSDSTITYKKFKDCANIISKLTK